MPRIRLVRRHGSFAVLFVSGAVLRLIAVLTFRPALEFLQDSYQYLQNAQNLRPDVQRPLLYPLVLRIVSHLGGVGVLAVVQHAAALGAAAVLYATLLRVGVHRHLAAVATAPFLLDSYQVDIEHFVLSETLFEVLLVAVIACLLWPSRPTAGVAVLAGFALAGATLTRSVGLPLIVSSLVLLLVRRVGWRTLGAFVVATAVPLVAYAGWFAAANGSFGLQSYSGMMLASRAMTIANCSRIAVPPVERGLCVPQPPSHRRSADWYAQFPASPLRRLSVPSGTSYDSVARDFGVRVIRAQPGDFALLTGRTFVHYFDLRRVTGPTDTPLRDWRFQDVRLPRREYPLRPLRNPYRGSLPYFGGNGQVTVAGVGFHGIRTAPAIAPAGRRWLAAYQHVAYTPGPLLAVFVLLAAAAGLVRLPEDQRDLRRAALFLTSCGLVLLLLSAVTATFDYRYLLPELPLLSAAGALAAELFLRRTRWSRRYPVATPTPDSISDGGRGSVRSSIAYTLLSERTR